MKLALASAPLLLLTACASIVNGPSQKVAIVSTPPGAKVTVTDAKGNSVAETNTPAVVLLNRGQSYFSGQEYMVRVETNGFQASEVKLTPSISGWYFGNILFGGVIGLAGVDPATGAMWTLEPKNVDVKLSEEASKTATAGTK